MRKCECGHELKEGKKPCFFCDGVGCDFCEDGLLTIVWCENKECPIKNANLDRE